MKKPIPEYKYFNFPSKPNCPLLKKQYEIQKTGGVFSRGFDKLNYSPLPVRKEFTKPITLTELKNINYEKGKHKIPTKVSDYIAESLVKFFRSFADLYFQKRYIDRVIIIETVAAIPGIVGGLYQHLFSLRNCVDSGEKIQQLLREAENERQHFLAFTAIKKPNLLDSFLIKFGQAFFFNFYMVFYGLFPKTAHRFVGYLEEEAIISYDVFEQEILKGNIENVPAPNIAINYWKLPENARLLDLVRAVRADEAQHRDANHKLADG